MTASTQKTQTLRRQFAQLRNELQMLTQEYRNMSQAEQQSARGRELQKKIDEVAERAGNVKDIMADTQRQI